MDNFLEFDTEQRRLAILKNLQSALSYTSNEVLLKGRLRQKGHIVSTDTLRGDVRFLYDHDCVNYDTDSGVWIVSLTRKGNEVADGLQHVNGVARPEPV